MRREEIGIDTPFIRLDALLKFCGEAQTGGHAKEIIAGGGVTVDGEPCVQRGKKIYPGMLVETGGAALTVVTGRGLP